MWKEDMNLILKNLLLLLCLFPYVVANAFPTYDMSEELIKSAHTRSKYYLTSSFFDFGVGYQEFTEKADKTKGLIIHSHGCSGVGKDESEIRSFYTKLGFYVVILDFLKRGDAKASCTVSNSVLTYHDSVFLRLPPRVKELQNHVNLLREAGFEKIYITGHSEGGMVVQNFPDEVSGAIIHSMFCIPLVVHANNLNTRYLHLVSFNDPLLTRPGMSHVCNNRPNYTTATSRVASHGPLADPSWPEKIRNFLGLAN